MYVSRSCHAMNWYRNAWCDMVWYGVRSMLWNSIVLYRIVLYCIVLHCTVLYCIVLYCNCTAKTYDLPATLRDGFKES